MIVTTTTSIEGFEIKEYKGIVFGEVVTGVNAFKDIAAGFRDFFGGRSSTYENELQMAREEAIAEATQRAQRMGANAIVGAKVDYETLGERNGMLMVTISGTAVIVAKTV